MPAIAVCLRLQSQSARYKQSIRRKGINSIFFDACLSLFFSKFNPTFPIVHEPTWKLKTTGPFLLLNMVAIGSLFIGNDDAISKGEFLWEIAQTAAATRWNYSYGVNLRHVSGDYPNTQIVTTAVLGQLYAMMSKVRIPSYAQSSSYSAVSQIEAHGSNASWLGFQLGTHTRHV